MYVFYTKKDIINRLNNYLDDYNSMKELCSLCNNNVNEIYYNIFLIINYVLKYHYNFIKTTSNIVDCYYNALKNKNNKQRNNNDVLNGEINKKDSNGIRIPNVHFIVKLCNENIQEREEKERKRHEFAARYDKLKGFNETGFTYTRPEMVSLDKDFNYYYVDCTGDICQDYYQLYKDERYNVDDDSPLRNGYYSNLNSINYSNNIQIIKLGNMYSIDNGRHRLLYVLYHSISENIPCTVTRRIEDKEFNIITNKLSKNNNAYLYKNNIFNDDPDIVICLNNKLYNTRSIEEIKDFYYHLNNKQYLSKYYVSDFHIVSFSDSLNTLYRYKKDLIEKFCEIGINFINMNFSDLLRIYPNYNNQLLYEAFNQLKTSYLRSFVFEKEKNLGRTLGEEYDHIIDVLDRNERLNSYKKKII